MSFVLVSFGQCELLCFAVKLNARSVVCNVQHTRYTYRTRGRCNVSVCGRKSREINTPQKIDPFSKTASKLKVTVRCVIYIYLIKQIYWALTYFNLLHLLLIIIVNIN